ncbi:MAG TPA: F0F1 ATP synthase subunit delta [Candidatus Saccharimonadales bacterium]|nr:F0F1 ATP synthase subunit delta [Candidatus Saccharimonadales bacterium]
MRLPRNELVMVLSKLSGELPTKKFVAETASYLLSERRTGELESLARDFVNLRADDGVVEVTAVSAHRLTETALSEVEAKIKQIYPSATRVIINQRIDETQIGGVRLELPDKLLDLSVRGKINQFKQLTVGD